MTRVLLFVLTLSVLMLSCATLRAFEMKETPATARLPAIATDTPVDTPTAQPTDAPEPTATPEPAAEPTSTPAPQPALISEVLPAVQPPQAAPEPVPIRGGTQLPLPDGTTVVWSGCATDGQCYWYNFYWAPTREAVMQQGEAQYKVQHEMCHAHQHWSINGGAPLAPSDYDLESWYGTAEGQSFATAVAGLSWPWSHSAVSGLEDFAWTCAYWYLDPAYLLETSPARYDWAADSLP